MIPIKKFLIGIRPPVKLFRVGSLWGDIADAVLTVRADKHFGQDYFKRVATNEVRDRVNLTNEDGSTSLAVSPDDVVFSKHGYFGGSSVNAGKVLEEFKILWSIVNEILDVREVRRIGMVGEVRFLDIETPSRVLLDKLVKTDDVQSHPAAFLLTWENRTPKAGITKVNTAVDDFENEICQFYDSVRDADDKSDTAFNANFDFQRYFDPLLKASNLSVPLDVHFRAFEDRMRNFKARLERLGLKNG